MIVEKASTAEIFLVEDNEGDILLTKEAFADASIKNNISVAKDGEQALDFLHKRNGYEEAVTPDLILLDLNIPKLDGREVLHNIKTDSKLRSLPVVILTSSKAEEDILKTYELHANSYVVKPVDIAKFTTVVSALEKFWFSVAVLPTPRDLHE